MGTGKRLGLWALFSLQLVCALLLLGEAFADIAGFDQPVGTADNDAFEYVIVFALLLSLVFTGFELRKVFNRQAKIEGQLKMASGAFSKLLGEHFDEWGLTPSEKDVALLAIKGLSIAEIANLRQTKDGTIKAQCNAIYRKAGVTGRPQLLSMFIEELMGEALIDGEAT
ncbi:MAG: helix-turn-helix transcriptional regulator [Stappiaceae bacterium]